MFYSLFVLHVVLYLNYYIFKVLMINGQEVSDMLHDDVVNLIRAARDIENNSKLVLTVQQRGIL